MKIKALQMFGFKSFGDRTELRFDNGIVGVVGPNGCGKSNIVDAIRWAMGEQSAKGLRGNEMQDVIFNGTATRKKASFAEVSLIFDNADRLAPSPYTEVAEVMITRRLYRSGDSEYLINKVPVRLKDVTDVFLGTGSSARAYSIVAQGKVDQVVLAKPEDRRFLLEEAAGTAKYKARKVAAERKMDATRTNLERVHDIIRELERSAKYLERQVDKAEQFRRLQGELRQLDEQIVGFKITALDQKANVNHTDREKSQEAFTNVSTRLLEAETEIESLRLEALNQEKASTTDYERLIQLKEQTAIAEKDIEVKSQRIQLLKHQIEERQKDIERIQSKSLANDQAKQQFIFDKNQLLEVRITQEAELSTLKDQMKLAETGIAQLQDELRVVEVRYQEQKTLAAKEAQRIEMLQSERVSTELLRAECERAIEEVLSQIRIATEERQIKELAVQEIDQNAVALESERVSLELRSEELRKVQSDFYQKRSEFKSEISHRESEIESLQSLEEHEVGYEAGALERKKKTGEPFLLDLLKFKPEYQKLGDGFLYELGQNFLDPQIADSDTDLSRWSALISNQTSNPSSFQGLSLLEALDGDIPENLRSVLKEIEIVDLLDANSDRIQIDRLGQVSIPFGGAQLRSQGLIKRKETPFGRKSEMERLSAEKAQLAVELTQLESHLESIKTELEDGSKRIQTIRSQSKDLTNRLREAQAVLSKLDSRISGLDARKNQKQAELGGCDLKIEELSLRLSEAKAIEVSAELESLAASLREKIRASELQKADLDRVWIEKRIAFGAIEEKLERLDQQSIHAEMTHSEYQHNQQLYATDVQNWSEEIRLEDVRILELRATREVSFVESVSLEKNLAETKSRLNRVRSDLEQREVGRKDIQRDKDQQQKRVQDLELEHQRLVHEVDELSKIIFERYHITIQDILQTVKPEDLERLQDETVLGAVEVEALELRAKIEKFGEVNLLALSEFKEITERLEFMNTQREDLLKTLDALQSIIDRINKITEFRFRETFKAINHNFQILFPKLFGGGRAYMTLTNESDLLETGVEIFAEPPGKKVQAMSLLSGGEKAMTSISLLFALFAYRPASFCILDEVDAPLDEVNTSRYNGIIREMCSLSQFIVITHNKKTMEIADTLFGVTMQDPGVSQMVGVQLNEARAFVASAGAA